MTFNIIISRSAFFDENDSIRVEIQRFLTLSESENIKIFIVTRNQSIGKYRSIIRQETGKSDIGFIPRHKAHSKFKQTLDFDVMLIGFVDEDIRIAANNKILLINPGWLNNVADKIDKYGFKLTNIEQLIECIDILRQKPEIYYEAQIDPNVKLLSLSDAKTYYAVKEEKEIKNIYQRTLKRNNELYRYAVYFHYLTMIYGITTLHNVDYWMSIPSSDGNNENYVYEIVKRTRYLLNNRSSKELLIRHTVAEKSTYMSKDERIEQGTRRHLNTIHLNEAYKGKLKGKKVVILDDYTTYGYSFECARNLLLAEGVDSIIFIAIGSFQSTYNKEDYSLKGDLYSPDFIFDKISEQYITGIKNDDAQSMLTKIYKIIS